MEKHKDILWGVFWGVTTVAVIAAFTMKNSGPFVGFLALIAIMCVILGAGVLTPQVRKAAPVRSKNSYVQVPHVTREEAEFYARKAMENQEAKKADTETAQPARKEPKVPSKIWDSMGGIIVKYGQLIAGALFLVAGLFITLSSADLYGTEAFWRAFFGVVMILIGAGFALAQYGKLGGFATWWSKELKVFTFIALALLVAAYAYFAHRESGLPALEDPWTLVFFGAIAVAFLVTLHVFGKLGVFLQKAGSALAWAFTTTPIAFFSWGILLTGGAVMYFSGGGDMHIATWTAVGGIIFVIGGFLSLGKDGAKYLREK